MAAGGEVPEGESEVAAQSLDRRRSLAAHADPTTPDEGTALTSAVHHCPVLSVSAIITEILHDAGLASLGHERSNLKPSA